MKNEHVQLMETWYYRMLNHWDRSFFEEIYGALQDTDWDSS